MGVLGPPRYEIVSHNDRGLMWMHDIMGFSCTWLGFPILSVLFALLTGWVATSGRIGMAMFFSVWMLNTAFWSVMGDYQPARLAQEPNETNSYVTWWEKMMVYSFVDKILAKITLVSAFILGLFQVSYT